MKLVSVVIPCLNEEKNIPLIVPEIIKNIPSKYSWEIILVDDGSSDKTKEEILRLALKNKRIKGIFFHRRFGHQAGLVSGISGAKGDAVILLDADFQHPPKHIKDFITLWEKGYDLVQGQKKDDESVNGIQKIFRSIAYSVWSKISDGILVPGVSDFRLMSKNVAKYVTETGEREVFLRGLVQLAAKNPTYFQYNVGVRKHGKSSYTTKMFINMFINGFISFSPKPLRFAFILGLFLTLSSATYLISDVIYRFITGTPIIEGWTSLIFLILITNGFILIYLGLLGEYIGVIFREVKERPKYLIDSTINL